MGRHRFLVLTPASERPAAGVIARLEHAFALREELDPFGVASPSHPLARTLEKIRRSGSAVQEIILAPLSFDDMEQLVTDSLRCESNRARLLAQVVHEKTGGNPFFAIQFLTASAE